MPDMLVNLLHLPADDTEAALRAEGIQIRRAMAPDKQQIVQWVQAHDNAFAAGECDVCFSRIPVSAFIATHGATPVGYACYHATAPDFFGPTAVDAAYRGKGIGKALLLRCLQAMRQEGYAYAIIGGVGPAAFYTKAVGATLIPDSDPGVYANFLGGMEPNADL